ncbi:MAG: V-type ATP synthase subunit E [Candidatus Wallacebacter cryptica]|jgi:V/A-type H+-transporting ATPase subunit E|nr:hypothetical protein [Bacillota bacterium]
MTGVEQLTSKIIEDAKLRAAERKKQAEEEKAAILEQTRERAQVECDKITAEAKARGEELYNRLISVAQLNARKEKLQAKQDVIASAFDQALAKLRSLPDDRYFDLIKDLIVQGSTTGSEQIILSEADHKRLPEGFLEQVNAVVKEKGLSGSLKLAQETGPIQGGVILKAGNITVNYTFEALLKQNYDQLAMEVAGLLFS